ncbi:hypothetical protein [Bacillus sp. 1006-3]|uniref:hypothetical protein n=1 Tax=Bacillus sp. 1006-3 TaxID=2922309 RepID=UPI001F0E9347|nr:hypothetical protein [Bacillus sp. 1006-3]MCH4866802.1 hypothetical protein [Bacillus sp. 1006-3]
MGKKDVAQVLQKNYDYFLNQKREACSEYEQREYGIRANTIWILSQQLGVRLKTE